MSKAKQAFIMESPPKIMQELGDYLRAKGHSCVRVLGMKNHKFEWCQKQECPETVAYRAMQARQKDQDELVAKLKKEGHICVQILETFPSQTVWCEHEPCLKRRQK